MLILLDGVALQYVTHVCGYVTFEKLTRLKAYHFCTSSTLPTLKVYRYKHKYKRTFYIELFRYSKTLYERAINFIGMYYLHFTCYLKQ